MPMPVKILHHLIETYRSCKEASDVPSEPSESGDEFSDQRSNTADDDDDDVLSFLFLFFQNVNTGCVSCLKVKKTLKKKYIHICN